MKRNHSKEQLEWLHGTMSKAKVTCTRCPGSKPMAKVLYLVHAKLKHRTDWENYWSIPPTALSIPDDVLNQEEVL